MTIQERKLQCIEQIILTKDENLISTMEAVLKSKRKATPKSHKKVDEKPWMQFFGTMDNETAEKMMRDIEEGCENIDYESWK